MRPGAKRSSTAVPEVPTPGLPPIRGWAVGYLECRWRFPKNDRAAHPGAELDGEACGFQGTFCNLGKHVRFGEFLGPDHNRLLRSQTRPSDGGDKSHGQAERLGKFEARNPKSETNPKARNPNCLRRTLHRALQQQRTTPPTKWEGRGTTEGNTLMRSLGFSGR